MKRFVISNTSCFSNLYLIECLRKCKSKSYLKSIMMIIGRQMRENTIPDDFSSKHEVCFMMKSAFKVLDTCLWYLDSGYSRHMTGDHSLSLRISSLRKVAMSLLVMGANHKLKERESSLYLDYRTLQMFYL